MSLAVTIGTDLTFGGRPSRPKGSKSYIIWGFPKIRGTLCWGPYNKDPTTSGTIMVPYFRKLPYGEYSPNEVLV